MKQSSNKFVRNLVNALTSLRPGADRTLLMHVSNQIEALRRENQALFAALSLPPEALWRQKPAPTAGGPAPSAFPNSTLCRETSFHEPYFTYWTQRIGQPLRYHRKLWEFVFVCQALYERGFLQHGFNGLGFGVGEEPLCAFFASQGCRILGTDLGAEAAIGKGWIDTQQHASGKNALRIPHVCPDDLFDHNVDFRAVDMNLIPDDLTGFDFCWSACALEHLGTIDKGLAFVENSLKTLRPGGLAVHTTEYNLNSNDETMEAGDTVLFRRQDFEALAARLTAQGHKVAPLDLEPGVGVIDRYIDLPPYRAEPHLQMLMNSFTTTSAGLIIQKAA